MAAAAAAAFAPAADDGELKDDREPPRRWTRQWMPQESVLNNGKCFLLKWVADIDKEVQSSSQPKGFETAPALSPGGAARGTVFVCNIDGCAKVFLDAGALRKHSHVHGERQYICHYDGCGKRFVDSSKLKRHFLIHTGEKHFICPFEGCGKAFSLDFNRRSHMRTHTGENYHTCPVLDCGKRFAHENKLRAHLQSAHTEKDAKDAGLDQEREEEPGEVIVEDLPAEINSDRPFCCPFEGCGKRYIHEYKLNLHLKREHASAAERVERRVGEGHPAELDSEGDERENLPLTQTGRRDKMGAVDDSRRGQKRISKRRNDDDRKEKKRARPSKERLKGAGEMPTIGPRTEALERGRSGRESGTGSEMGIRNSCLVPGEELELGGDEAEAEDRVGWREASQREVDEEVTEDSDNE